MTRPTAGSTSDRPSHERDEQAVDAPADDPADEGDADGRVRVASTTMLDWFEETIEHERSICNNCFGRRYPEDEEKGYFRTAGGNNQTHDWFCRCGAGRGKQDIRSSAENIATAEESLPPCLRNDLGGTVTREWSSGNALPENGDGLTFTTLMVNLRHQLERLDYTVDWERARALGAKLKVKHPSRDRPIFARVFYQCAEPPNAASDDTADDADGGTVDAAVDRS